MGLENCTGHQNTSSLVRAETASVLLIWWRQGHGQRLLPGQRGSTARWSVGERACVLCDWPVGTGREDELSVELFGPNLKVSIDRSNREREREIVYV